MRYIKSHSNYVLKTKHKLTNDGTIYERDITTIGGRNQFAPGQVPIYKSGNFVITINNTESKVNDYSKTSWHSNPNGNVWTMDSINDFSKDNTASHENDIVIKNDFYDLSDFAYFGSCSELVRSSINDILELFPGELYAPYDNNSAFTHTIETVIFTSDTQYEGTVTTTTAYYYTEKDAIEAGYTGDTDTWRNIGKIGGTKKKYVVNLPSKFGGDAFIDFGNEIERNCKGEYQFDTENKPIIKNYSEGKNLYLVDNPFNINIHDVNVSESITDANPTKYFTNYCYENFDAIDKDGNKYNFTYHPIPSAKNFISINGMYLTNNTEYNGRKHHSPITVTYFVNDITTKEILYEGTTVIQPNCTYEINFETEVETEINISAEFSPCVGDKVGDVVIDILDDNGTVIDKVFIYVYMDDNMQYIYLVDDSSIDTSYVFEASPERINADNTLPPIEVVSNAYTNVSHESFKYRFRPKERFFKEFLLKLDEFERLLVNTATTPSYTATFRVIGENDLGYYDYFEKFTFPTTYGGYNLGSNGHVFDEYVRRLSEISEFYDNHLSDNIYRSLTHESIKNFDWTYYKRTDEDEELHVIGASRIANMLRLYGRVFDNLKLYADSISNSYTVTYDNVNNLPDYFFTDVLDNYGWDLQQILPLNLHEYIGDNPYDPEKQVYDATEEQEKTNTYNGNVLHRLFTSCDDLLITPYTVSCDYWQNGYFYGCVNTMSKNYEFERVPSDISFNGEGGNYGQINVTSLTDPSYGSATTKFDRYYDEDGNEHLIEGDYFFTNKGFMLKRIRNYSSEKQWTMPQVNNEFMKRLILNTHDILRHKGTIDAIEMVCAMFGMKSKRWYELLSDSEKSKYSRYEYMPYDFDVKEYTLFTKRIRDPWDLYFNYYMYDSYNRSKTIQYDTESYVNGIYVPYQGIMAAYRYSTINYESIDDSGNVITTTNEEEAIVDDNGNKVKTRYIYPDFQKNQIYDGNVYYQMNGGWINKSPFIFDVDNNILCREKIDNKRLYKETIRNIKSVSELKDLFSIPSQSLDNGNVVYVDNISTTYAIIDGIVYDVYQEYYSNDEYYYIETVPFNNVVVVGNAVFEDYIIISTPYSSTNKLKYNIGDGEYNDTTIRIYILKEDGKYKIDAYSENTSISTFSMFMGGTYMEGDDFTHYFRINNIENTGELSVLGWQQLTNRDYDYYRINSLYDYFKGNNPHTGHMRYDSGHEYLTYLRKLFKYADENGEFDYAYLYNNGYGEDDNIIEDFGFKGLIKDDFCNTDYNDYLVEDSKVHFFGNKFTPTYTNKEIVTSWIANDNGYSTPRYSENTNIVSTSYTYSIEHVDENNITNNTNVFYNLESIRTIESDLNSNTYGSSYSYDDNEEIDGVTNQIVNTKRIGITFYLRSEDSAYNRDSLEEIKYIDSVVLPYVEQVLPSTVICDVEYVYKGEEYDYYYIYGDSDCEGEEVIFNINGEWKTMGHIENGKCIVKMNRNSSEGNSYEVKLSNGLSSSTLSIEGDSYIEVPYNPIDNITLTAVTSFTSTQHITNGQTTGIVDANNEEGLTFETIDYITPSGVTCEVVSDTERIISDFSFIDNVLTLTANINQTENEKYATIKLSFYDNVEYVKIVQNTCYDYDTYVLYVKDIGLQTFKFVKTDDESVVYASGNTETETIYGNVKVESNDSRNEFVITYKCMSSISPENVKASIVGTPPSSNVDYEVGLAEGQTDTLSFDNDGGSQTVDIVAQKTEYTYTINPDNVIIYRNRENTIEPTRNAGSTVVLTDIRVSEDLNWATCSILGTTISVNVGYNYEEFTRSGNIYITVYDEGIQQGNRIDVFVTQTSSEYVFKFASENTSETININDYVATSMNIQWNDATYAIVSSYQGEYTPVSVLSVSERTQANCSLLQNNGNKIPYTFSISKNTSFVSRTIVITFIQTLSNKTIELNITQTMVVPQIGDCITIGSNDTYYAVDVAHGDSIPAGTNALGILVCPENVISDGYARLLSLYDVFDGEDYVTKFSDNETYNSEARSTEEIGICDTLHEVEVLNGDNPNQQSSRMVVDWGMFGHQGSPSAKRTWAMPTKVNGETVYYDHENNRLIALPLLYDSNTKTYAINNLYVNDRFTYRETRTVTCRNHYTEQYEHITGNVLTQLDGSDYIKHAVNIYNNCSEKAFLFSDLFPIYEAFNYNYQNKQWYLPTIGELGIVAQFLEKINEQLGSKWQRIDTSENAYYWSCVPAWMSNKDEDYGWAVRFCYGEMVRMDRQRFAKIRAFLKVKFNSN